MRHLMTALGQLQTLLDRLSAEKSGRIDAAVSSRAPANTALSSNVWSAAHADQIANAAQEDTPILAPPMANGINSAVLAGFDNVATSINELWLSCPHTVINIVSTALTEIFSVSGAGVIDMLGVVCNAVYAGSGTRYAYLKLEVDGVDATPLFSTHVDADGGKIGAAVCIGNLLRSPYWNGSSALTLYQLSSGNQVPFKQSLRLFGYRSDAFVTGRAYLHIRRSA